MFLPVSHTSCELVSMYSPETTPTTTLDFPPSEEKNRAMHIVENNSYDEAMRVLTEEGLLEEERIHTQKEYETCLEQAEFLTEHDWEMLTLIRLYSPDLLTHSIETFTLAKEKIESIFIGNETIAQMIERENVSLTEFYRACLLHDIGKLNIPEPILNYTLVPGDWFALSKILREEVPNKHILHYLGLENESTQTPEHMVETLIQSEISPVTMLPVCKLLTEDEQTLLHTRGISLDLTLREVLELHEPASFAILKDVGLVTEAYIAGQHHNYAKHSYRYPISSQTVGIHADLSDLLHLADEEQALRSKRAYKPAFSHAKACALLAKDAEKGSVNEELTALWIQHDFNTVLETATQEDAKHVAFLKSFIQTHATRTNTQTNATT